MSINRFDLFFEAPDAEPGQHKVVKLFVGQKEEDRDDCEAHEMLCVASEEWPCLYHASVTIRLGPLAQRADRNLGTLKFPPHVGVVKRAFLLCGYDAVQARPDERCSKRQWRGESTESMTSKVLR